MYDYDEVYEKIMESVELVNLPPEESIKIVNKIYKDLEIGLLKPRNLTKKTQHLICNSLTRQNQQKEDLTIEHYQVTNFIEKMKPKLIISDKELDDLEKRLLDLNFVNEKILEDTLKDYLKEIDNDSLKMIRNKSFRELDQAIIAVDSKRLANKFGLFDERIIFYSFIDHNHGLLFELLTEGNDENFILPKSEVENEIIRHMDKEDIEIDEYRDIRNLKIIDKFRDDNNPDIISVKFIESGKSEYIKVKLEEIVESKLIGKVVEDPVKISNVSFGDEVVVSYCYDYTDEIHLYVKGNNRELASILRIIYESLQNASKETVSYILAKYKNTKEFDFIVDTFHSIIFDYYRDINEFYRAIDKEVATCI